MKHWCLVDRTTDEIVGCSPAPYVTDRALLPPGAEPPIIPPGCDVIEVDDKPEGVFGPFDRKRRRITIDQKRTQEQRRAMLDRKVKAAEQDLADAQAALAALDAATKVP